MSRPHHSYGRYRAVTRQTIADQPEWSLLPAEEREGVQVVSRVLPFRANEYVLRELIDWRRVPDDPMYQLTFPQRGMLDADDYAAMRALLRRGAGEDEVNALANEIRRRLNPHPAGQLTHNVPEQDGEKVPGLQHKYRETVLFFPAQGQTCHAYCTYCFRWAQFVGLPDLKFQARETAELVAYLESHPLVSDVLFTGGDPLIMKTEALRRYVEPLLRPDLGRLQTLRFGTKALGYWPQRFTTDDDADDLLRLFEEIVASGRHLAVMAHYSHPVELHTPLAQEAARRVRATGAEIRMQAPVVRHVNDHPAPWAEMWRLGVRLGMVPYYMFVERDTGPKNYFEVPLARAHQIFRQAYRRVSGLARTARGPSMSAWPGKVRVVGTAEVAGEEVFVLDFLQAREPSWVRKPFFARYDAEATWLDQLEPAFGEERFFFAQEGAVYRDARHELPAWVA
jgi:L-lysine 2,3-aminomutase